MLLIYIKIIMERMELRLWIVYEKLLRVIIEKPPNIGLGSFGRKLSHTCHSGKPQSTRFHCTISLVIVTIANSEGEVKSRVK